MACAPAGGDAGAAAAGGEGEVLFAPQPLPLLRVTGVEGVACGLAGVAAAGDDGAGDAAAAGAAAGAEG